MSIEVDSYMLSAGYALLNPVIFLGDLLAVDRSKEARHGEVIIAVLNGEPICKRLHRRDGITMLLFDNKAYPPRYIMEGDKSWSNGVWYARACVVERLYRPGYRYRKAEVLLMDLRQPEEVTGDRQKMRMNAQIL